MPIFGRGKERKQQRELEAFATLHGLQFSMVDAFGLAGLPFPLFSAGAGCKDVVYGTWNDLNAWAFVAWQLLRDQDQEYTCAAAPLPADCPALDIHSTNTMGRVLKSVGVGTPLQFESEAFNRVFTVSSAEPKFAYEVVTAQMMEWLLQQPQGWHFCISRNYILVFRERESGDVDQTAQVLDLVTGFYRQIPNVVAILHKLNLQPQMTPELALEMQQARAAGFSPVMPGGGFTPPVTEETTAGAAAAADPSVAAALRQLQAMGIAVSPDTKVEVQTTSGTFVSPGPGVLGAAALGAPGAIGGGAGAGAITGRLTVTGIQELGVSVEAGRLVQMEMDVTPDGRATYHLAQPVLVTPDHADRVKAGASFGVKIDPSNPAMLTVEWGSD
jgi:hypothetical protein